MYEPAPEHLTNPAAETLWVTLKVPLQAMPQIQVLHHQPAPAPVSRLLLNRDQARLFLALMSQLGEQPGNRLQVSPQAPGIRQALLQQVQQRLDQSSPNSLGHSQQDTDSVTFHALVTDTSAEWQLARLHFQGGDLWIGSNSLKAGDRLPVRIYATDVSISLTAHTDSSFLNILPVTLTRIEESPLAGMCQLLLRAGHDGLSEVLIPARISRRSAKQLWLTPGLRLWAQIKSAAIVT